MIRAAEDSGELTPDKTILEPTSGLSGIALFFFSSRRRHTRFDCDWSSDVCSSDLHERLVGVLGNELVAVGVHHQHQRRRRQRRDLLLDVGQCPGRQQNEDKKSNQRSEEHTSELQSQSNLVCRLLLGKKYQFSQSYL